MKMPHELMGKNYCGPANIISLEQIPYKDFFRFIGIAGDGGEHYCIVRKNDHGFYMASNTVAFQELIGWVPDMGAQSEEGSA